MLRRKLIDANDPDLHFKLALSIALALLIAIFFAAAFEARSSAYRQADSRARNMADVLQSYTQNVFDGYAQTIDRVADATVGLPDREILRSANLHKFLARIVSDHPQVGSLWIIAANGSVLASSAEFPPPAMDLSNRSYMRAFREGERGIYVGEKIIGDTTRQEVFTVSRPRLTTRGDFDGAIVVAARPEQFAQVFASSAQGSDYAAALVLSDGRFLMRTAEMPRSTTRLEVPPAFFTHTRASDSGLWQGRSLNDGVERIVAFKKLEGYPVIALFELGTSAIREVWLRRVEIYAGFAVPAAAILAWLSAVALRKAREERESLARLQEEVRLRKRTEARLLEAQKMEAIGQLTSGIAHDFNNLLTVLMGNAEMLERAKPERRERLLGSMFASIERARQLTSQLLAFARRQPLLPEMVEINKLILGMRELLQESLRSDVELVLDLAPDLWPVRVDPAQLRVALINISANARDAMPGGGRLTIRTMNNSGKGAGDPGLVCIEVSDTGMGMTPDIMARAFDPFFTSKGVGKGTGLGLSQVYGFAEQSGGTVHLESAPGAGTTVVLRFPRAEMRERRTDVAAVYKMGPLRVLLVEDNEEVAEIGRQILSELGHQVVHASGSSSALDLLEKEGPFDLVFTDVIMPGGMDGVELARHVRQTCPETAIVVTTGYIDAVRREEAAGFVLLSKPYSRDDLAEAIAAATGQPPVSATNVVAFKG